MNDEQPQSECDDAIDRLVREYVDRQTQGIDETPLLARVRADRRGKSVTDEPRHHTFPVSQPHPARRASRSLTWAVVTAAALVAAFAGGRYLEPHTANAAVMLRNVYSEHARAIDRCYRVQFAPDPRFWDPAKKLEGPSTSVLWTRGDRFWSDCTIGDQSLTVGREAGGTFWVSPSPAKGIRFTNDLSDLPKPVAVLCEVNSMSVPQLVVDVLADFDLHADPSAQQSTDAKTLVWARLKPGRTHPLLSNALLEIDPETNILNRLVLWTVRNGRPHGTVTYTLIESSTQADDRYRMQSHLDEDAEIEVHKLTEIRS